jgi:hypothetical protein
MQMQMVGKIAAIIGMVAILLGIVMAIGILPAGFLFGVTPGGALDGAVAFFLMAMACFMWPAAMGAGGGEPV